MNPTSIARTVQSLLPRQVVPPARRCFFKMRAALFRGRAVHCPCCGGRYSRFLTVGKPPRRVACPGCDSRERHRLLHLFLTQRTDLFRQRLRILHVAPEDSLQRQLANSSGVDYVSADLSSSTAMMRMDIMDIQFPDDSFDVILCNHVLEHVPDDGRAMRELLRVLRPGGWAILQVPIDSSRTQTFEDPRVTAPLERERLFGQWDHVRSYGRDYPERLRAAGFDVSVEKFVAELPGSTVADCGLDESEDIYYCRKPRP